MGTVAMALIRVESFLLATKLSVDFIASISLEDEADMFVKAVLVCGRTVQMQSVTKFGATIES